MILSITTLNKEANHRFFSFYCDELEVGFDVLTNILANGDSLLTAELIDKGQITRLPIEAFDGEKLSVPLKAMKREWQESLRKPVS